MNFNPRSPYGERRVPYAANSSIASISIHAPLTGSDAWMRRPSMRLINFNPRSPYGERPGNCIRGRPIYPISIHAPLTGSDKRPLTAG